MNLGTPQDPFEVVVNVVERVSATVVVVEVALPNPGMRVKFARPRWRELRGNETPTPASSAVTSRGRRPGPGHA